MMEDNIEKECIYICMTGLLCYIVNQLFFKKKAAGVQECFTIFKGYSPFIVIIKYGYILFYNISL